MKKIFTIFLIVLFTFTLLAGCNNKSKNSNPINTSPVGFTVSITSKPTGASVFVNDEYEGITPREVSLKKGIYRFIVIKDNYISQRKDVEITENTSLNFELKKPKIKGTLNSISFEELKGGITFNELFISHRGNEIVCISLVTGKELWRKNFDSATNFMLVNDTLYLENQKRAEATETSPRKVIEEIFAVNPYNGEIIMKENIEIIPDEKNTIIQFDGVNEGIAFFKEFVLMFGGIPNKIYLKAYFLKSHKLLYDKKFNSYPVNTPIFGDHLYLFGSSDNHLMIYKVNKFTGDVISQMNFTEIPCCMLNIIPEKLNVSGEKIVLKASNPEALTYVIDLEKQKILFKSKGNFNVQNEQYLITFDEYDSENIVSIEVIDLLSMVRRSLIAYDLTKENKEIYPLLVTFPVYDSQNRRIFTFINDKMFCFNEKGKEMPIPEIFKNSYRYLLSLSPTDRPYIYIDPHSSVTILRRDEGQQRVFVFDSKTFEPIFVTSSAGLIIENSLLLFNVVVKGDPSQNLLDKGVLTIIDLEEFIGK